VLGTAAVLVLAGCASAAGVLAAKWAAPDLTPLERATEPVVVFAEVSEQPLRKPVSVVGTVHPPQTKDVYAPNTAATNNDPSIDPTNWGAATVAVPTTGNEDTAKEDNAADNQPEPDEPAELETLRQVVTVQKVSAGDLIEPGDVVAEVSGRPVFALPPGMPFYRNLAIETKGADVSALQRFLEQTGHFGGSVDGGFGPATLAGLRSLYREAGYDTPLADGVNPGFVLDEFVEVALSAVPVVEASAEGTALGDGVPLVRVVTGEPWVGARVTMLDVEALTVGAEVTVSADGVEPLSAVVSTVGEYQSDGTPGYDVTIPLPVEWFEGTGDVQQVTVEPAADAPNGPAVPATAVREDANGPYVLAAPEDGSGTVTARAEASGEGRLKRVPITITGQVGGYALIEPTEALPVGMRIVVSGDSADNS
jgi:hypothetical protein